MKHIQYTFAASILFVTVTGLYGQRPLTQADINRLQREAQTAINAGNLARAQEIHTALVNSRATQAANTVKTLIAQATIQQERTARGHLEQDRARLQQERKQLEQINQNLSRHLTLARDAIAFDAQNLARTEREVQAKTQQIEETQARLERTRQALAEQLNASMKRAQALETTSAEKQRLEGELAILQDLNTKQVEETLKLSKQVKDLNNQLTMSTRRSVEERASAKKEMDQLQQKLADFEAQSRKVAELEAQINKLAQEHQAELAAADLYSQGQINKLQEQVDKHLETIRKLGEAQAPDLKRIRNLEEETREKGERIRELELELEAAKRDARDTIRDLEARLRA
jgi:hypothetical protein